MTKTFNKVRNWIANNVKWSIGIALLLAACMIGPFVEENKETTNQDIYIEMEDITNNEDKIDMSDKDGKQVKEDVENSK